jgi:hypothetical protein
MGVRKRVDLAAVVGVEEPPADEFGWHINDVLTGLDQPLCKWTAGTGSGHDRPRLGPHPVRKPRH